jgi:hypothetical protein
MQVIIQDHYVPMVVYNAGAHTLTREKVGTRCALVAIRTLVDPNDAKDVRKVRALQDAIKVQQTAPGTFEVPSWDQASQKQVREALLALASTKPDFRRAFGAKGQVDPVRHLIGSAPAWCGNPDKDAVYLNVTPAKTTPCGCIARVPRFSTARSSFPRRGPRLEGLARGHEKRA